MNKIEKALERFKREGRSTTGQETEASSPGKMRSPDHQKKFYSHTKVIPTDRKHLEKNRLLMFLNDPIAVNAYNLLRTQILEKTRDQGHNTIMITSVLDGEGKTVTAINLAGSIAREVNHSVLLVDADLRNPTVQRYMGFLKAKGLSHYLQEDIPVEDLFINPGLDDMIVLPAGDPLSDATDLLASSKMERLVDGMKRRYPDRYVIFDTPPILPVPDALVLSAYVDGVILVVESDRTPKKQIRKAVDLLKDRNIIGVVMNKGERSKKERYYYYYY